MKLKFHNFVKFHKFVKFRKSNEKKNENFSLGKKVRNLFLEKIEKI